MKRIVLALLILLVFSSVADARWRLFGRRRGRTYSTYATAIDYGDAKTDQERCEVEAAYQAANYAYYHVGYNLGNFEGWGTGYSPNCATCTPRGGMTLTGDASCQAANGQWFRVRCWR